MARWDCTRKDHERCIANGQTFECGVPGYPERFTITSRADLERCLSYFREKEPQSHDIGICLRMGACPVGLMDHFSWEAWTLFNALKDGAPWPWPGGYYGQPSVYAQAARAFESELLLIKKEREAEESGRTGTIRPHS